MFLLILKYNYIHIFFVRLNSAGILPKIEQTIAHPNLTSGNEVGLIENAANSNTQELCSFEHERESSPCNGLNVHSVQHMEEEGEEPKHLNENAHAWNKVLEKQMNPVFFANTKLSPEYINLALKLENQDLTSMHFPSPDSRKFNPSWKQIVLPNKSVIVRKWLVYSQDKDALFCLPCLLFALPTERSIWGTAGYRGWSKHLGERDIALHEKSKYHVSAEIARIQWMSNKRIDSSLAEQTDQIVLHNREVLFVIVDCCRYLYEEMLGFRNKNVIKGKLIGIFRVLGKYSPDARVYLEKIIDKARLEKAKRRSNLLSYRNVYDLINAMNELVISKITNNIKLTKMYSVILDSTQDTSKKECTTVLIRYIEHIDTQGGS